MTETLLVLILSAVGLVFVAPVVVYLCVKLGVLGWLKARDQHRKQRRREKEEKSDNTNLN